MIMRFNRNKIANLCLDNIEAEYRLNSATDKYIEELTGSPLDTHIDLGSSSAGEMIDHMFGEYRSEDAYEFCRCICYNEPYHRLLYTKRECVDGVESDELDEFFATEGIELHSPKSREEFIDCLTVSAGLSHHDDNINLMELSHVWNGVPVYTNSDGEELVSKWHIPIEFNCKIMNGYGSFEEFTSERFNKGYEEDIYEGARERYSAKDSDSGGDE